MLTKKEKINKDKPEEEIIKIHNLEKSIKEKYLLAYKKNTKLLSYEDFLDVIENHIKNKEEYTTDKIIDELNRFIENEIEPYINELQENNNKEPIEINTKLNTEKPIKKEYSKSYAKIKDNGKSEYMAFRIPKEYCDKLREDAKNQDRSVANILKIILKNYYK